MGDVGTEQFVGYRQSHPTIGAYCTPAVLVHLTYASCPFTLQCANGPPTILRSSFPRPPEPTRPSFLVWEVAFGYTMSALSGQTHACCLCTASGWGWAWSSCWDWVHVPLQHPPPPPQGGNPHLGAVPQGVWGNRHAFWGGLPGQGVGEGYPCYGSYCDRNHSIPSIL